MKPIFSHWFAPLTQAVRAFFKHDVALRRQGGRVKLVLESRRPGGDKRMLTRAEQAAMRDLRDLGLARSELARLLDSEAGLRSSLRHLAYVEDALERGGWPGLRMVPQEVLQQALVQFEELITNWSAEGLACLRSKMAVVLTEREADPSAGLAQGRGVMAMLESPQVLAAAAIEVAMTPAEDDDAALRAAYEALGVADVERSAQ